MSRRWLLAAVLVPVLYFANLLVAGLLYPGYSHITQVPSDLGAVGSPHPAVFNLGLLLTAIALFLAAGALARAARALGADPSLMRGIALILLIASLYFVIVASLPLPDPRHDAAFPLLLPLHLGPFFLAKALWRRHDLRRLSIFLCVTGVLMLVLLAVALMLGQLVSPKIGLFIRIYALLAFGWIGVAGYVLMNRRD
jgi:hypothetical membrane protein